MSISQRAKNVLRIETNRLTTYEEIVKYENFSYGFRLNVMFAFEIFTGRKGG